jgi:hypothetical protein
MTVPFDRIFSSAPLNKTAGSVTSKGQAYTPDFVSPRAHWDAPPPCMPVPRSALNITGFTCGRLTVIGLIGRGGTGARTASWLVRCVCGTYEARTSKAIRNPANAHDRCQFCGHTRRLQRLGSQPRSVESFIADNGLGNPGERA